MQNQWSVFISLFLMLQTMEILTHSSYSASNNIRNLEAVLGLQAPFAAAMDQESSNSSIIKAKLNKRSRRNLKTKRGYFKNGIKRVQAHQIQEDDEEADTANSYTKKNEYKWLLEKELNRTADLSCRLLLGKELVFEKIMPHLDGDSAKACQTRTGLAFDVWDVDTKTQHQLVLSKWFTGFYSIDCNWKRDFVDRRELKIGDKIKFGLDEINSRFCFSVVRRSQD